MRCLGTVLVGVAVAVVVASSPVSAQTAGEPLSPWLPGGLDIHQILTGRGNAALLILPDGTSLLVDAGDGNPEPPRGAARAPDGSRPPGEWIARYARRMLARDPEPAIDYGLVTHFHGDHMAGFADVAEHIPIRLILDRGWPDYGYPRPIDTPVMDGYRSFVAEHDLNVERFQPGRRDQIVLEREAERYPSFEVRNLAANGEVWTGVSTTTRHHFPELETTPEEDWPNENQCSLAIRVSYGAFDWYTGGDMPARPFPGFPAWHGIGNPVARAAGPVDAAVVNHHGFTTGTTVAFAQSLRARVWIVPSRSAGQPSLWTLGTVTFEKVYPGPRDVFVLTLLDATRQVLGERTDALLSSDQGHIVIRVAPGGDRYHVVVVDETSEDDIVRSVHGPYLSR